MRAQGEDGVSPHIGENGNWYIGDIDTNVSASGVNGEPGPKGETGAQGHKGEKGDKGDTGATGATGPMGDLSNMDIVYSGVIKDRKSYPLLKKITDYSCPDT